MKKLKQHNKLNIKNRPVVLVIMDGVGIGENNEGDCVALAKTPTLDWLKDNAIYTEIKAHGKAVGLPEDTDMGNSEVGHMHIGAGRIIEQDLSRINHAIASGDFFSNPL